MIPVETADLSFHRFVEEMCDYADWPEQLEAGHVLAVRTGLALCLLSPPGGQRNIMLAVT